MFTHLSFFQVELNLKKQDCVYSIPTSSERTHQDSMKLSLNLKLGFSDICFFKCFIYFLFIYSCSDPNLWTSSVIDVRSVQRKRFIITHKIRIDKNRNWNHDAPYYFFQWTRRLVRPRRWNFETPREQEGTQSIAWWTTNSVSWNKKDSLTSSFVSPTPFEL